MSRKNELSKMTTKELRDLAKGLDIKGRWDMNKSELVSAIFKAESDSEKKTEESADVESAKDEQKIEEKAESVEQVNKEKNTTAADKVPKATAKTLEYLERAEIGSIVAFYDGERVRSAAIKNRSTKRKMLKLENAVGQEFIVSYNDVIWVRTGRRWPRGVYELFKSGVSANGKNTNNN